MQSHLLKDKDFALWTLLLQVRDALLKARRKELRQYGIKPIEAGALFFIQAIGDEATPAKLSRWLFREHPTVTALVRRMERKGLVIRTEAVGRTNGWNISLTKKGQRAYRQSIKMEWFHALLSSFSENERQRLKSYLKKMRDQTLKLLVDELVLPFP